MGGGWLTNIYFKFFFSFNADYALHLFTYRWGGSGRGGGVWGQGQFDKKKLPGGRQGIESNLNKKVGGSRQFFLYNLFGFNCFR